MGGQGVVRALVSAGTVAALALGLPSVASADETVVVRGTAFPDAAAQLAYVGCTDLLAPPEGQVLQPYIGRGPGQAPAGARSLGYDLAGGTAIGAQYVVGSMVTTSTASLGVFAPRGAQGLAVAGFQEPADAGTHLIWFGSAPISAAAGGWQTVEATPLAYTWTKYDMATRTAVPGQQPVPAQGVPEFAAAHGGDGAGLYAITFGCDGAPFSMDAMRIGSPGRVTTYDIEGLATVLTMTGSEAEVTLGEEVTLRGRLRATTGGRVRSATVILERRATTGGPWETVRVVRADEREAVARISPAQSAVYRWRFVDRPLAEGSVSPTFLVRVVPADAPEPPHTPTPPPTDDPTGDPTDDPTPDSDPESDPESTPTPTLPPPPSEPATPETTPSTPEASPSDLATASATAPEQPAA
jgi:hypothetical protein